MAPSHPTRHPRPLLQWLLALTVCLFVTQVSAASPQPLAPTGAPGVVSYQGQVSVDGQPYNGIGFFKFAVVDPDVELILWSNDGSSGKVSPVKGVPLEVRNGLFTVLLGDTGQRGMSQPLSPEVFSGGDATSGERYLRVWFSTDALSYTMLTPDQRIAAVPYALVAQDAVSAVNADQLDGQHASAFALSSHNHDAAYVNDNAGEVDNQDVQVGRLSPDRIDGTAWTRLNDGPASGLDADLVDGKHASDLAVPSGAMLLGVPGDTRLTDAGYELLGISNVTIDGYKGTWTATTVANAPTPRRYHSAVWTGTEMIIWGGIDNVGSTTTGARYNPATNTWTPMSTANAPSARIRHTAVWTGTQMIIWGGQNSPDYPITGGRYNPATDTWTPISTTNAPQGRYQHTAVWTGTEMIVFGGYSGGALNTGARYDPAADTWTAIANAPSAIYSHSAVWTGTEMIIWGGQGSSGGYTRSGSRYNLANNTWNATSLVNAPENRARHTAVWTGTEMIVWGGRFNYAYSTGGRYNPVTDSWIATSTVNAPLGRDNHTAVWTGSEMIVWGGDSNTGGRYNPTMDTWTATTTTNAPQNDISNSTVWIGTEMIVWGGQNDSGYSNNGGRYTALFGLYRKP